MKESDILYQRGSYWVSRTPRGYVVWKDGNVCASSVATFALTMDGHSLAIAYAEYMGKPIRGKK